MNRLRDDVGEDAASERGIELLRGTPPAAPTLDMKRRVWSAIQQSRMRAAGPSLSSRLLAMPGLKAVAMGVTIVSLAGTAGAVMAGRWIVPALYHRAARSTDLPSLDMGSDRARPARRIAGARLRAAARGAGQAAAASQGREEVLEALVVLRRDHNPSRAGALLDGYLSVRKQGALREEALALAIEAADARGDGAAAQRYARAYQAEFPRGRFGPFASSHIEK